MHIANAVVRTVYARSPALEVAIELPVRNGVSGGAVISSADTGAITGIELSLTDYRHCRCS